MHSRSMFGDPPMRDVLRRMTLVSLVVACMLASAAEVMHAQHAPAISAGDWMSAAANADVGFRSTQFFESGYDTGLLQWDSRVDVWLPPFRERFAWGPYLRVAVVASSQTQPWENAWFSRPGIGIQMYPVSLRRFQAPDSVAGRVLGPLRLFAEYNAQKYWGSENTWRPNHQVRAGLDYWKAINVNDAQKAWWLELWNGAFWQSSNEFATDYHTVIVANAARVGGRVPARGKWSLISPYGVVESSRTKNGSYYWENRLLLGAGGRISPPLSKKAPWLSRLVVYGEALRVASFYADVAPASVPRTDVRIGVSTSLGDWYK